MAAELPVRVLLTTHEQRRLPWDAKHPHAPTIITGHVLDEEALFKAVTGAHTIIHLASAQWWGRARDLERVEISGTRNLISVARSARVGRIVYLSHLGAAPSSGYTLHRIKGQVEELIRNSGLAYTIIRSGVVFGVEDAFINHIVWMLRANPFFFLMPGQGETIIHPIYIDDLVKAVYLSLESIEAIDRVYEIGGLEYTTLEDLLLTIMRVAGLPRLLIPTAPYLLRWSAWVYGRILPRTLMTTQWLDILATNRTANLGNLYQYFGFQPRRFEDTLLTYLPKQRYFLGWLRYSFRRRPRRI
jgi:NADH dehydrogenase